MSPVIAVSVNIICKSAFVDSADETDKDDLDGLQNLMVR